MSDLDALKRELRREYNGRRRALAPGEWARLSSVIRGRVERSDLYQDADTLLVYVSAKDNEVDTHTLIDRACAAGKCVLVPVTGAGRGEMRWALLRSRGELVRGRFNLLEPAPGKEVFVQPPENALCLVPGIAFTRDGLRLGYGGGFYDRFLASFDGPTVGLAFEVQLASTLPVTEGDFPVAHVVTEAAWYPAAPNTNE